MFFDGFPSENQANGFAEAVQKVSGNTKGFERTATVCQNQSESDKIDLFPFVLYPPIVVVNRDVNDSGEEQIKQLASQFEGVFAGT